MDVAESLRQARNNRQTQRRLLDELEGKVERRRADIRSSLADLPASQQSSLVSRAASGFLGELRRGTADTRVNHVRKGSLFAANAAAVPAHYRSPTQMLARYSLGSERRSRVLQQISASGPAELEALADLAAATRDMELAAALCSRIYELPSEKRSFSPQELADVLLGEEFRTVTRSLMEIERLAEEALADDSAFETGRKNEHRALNIAMMRRAEEAIGTALEQPEITQPEN
ncbi:hypothetical protein [Caulobacter sp. NIBR1757]|uniref:hypothetical protein n=1 Tax=Caulobacter sp. NIBR1757 TaxID=3016000 RepID=UPI0022F002DA|nr:hypothetical protein [Caulobacter sp. NIBR1757]